MSLLIFALISLIVLALAIWLIDTAPIGNATSKWPIKVLAAFIALVFIAQRAGWV